MKELVKWMVLIAIMAWVFLLVNGCSESRQIPCTKPAIQIADMSHNYKHCKGLYYEGKDK